MTGQKRDLPNSFAALLAEQQTHFDTLHARRLVAPPPWEGCERPVWINWMQMTDGERAKFDAEMEAWRERRLSPHGTQSRPTLRRIFWDGFKSAFGL